MKNRKKLVCMGIAVVVSLCFLVSVISTIGVVAAAAQSGSSVPAGMIMLSLVTLVCAVLIWKGVREME